MPTFTAVALDRLLEPGASKSVEKSVPSSNPVTKPRSLPKSKPVPNSNVERRNSTSVVERKPNRPQMSPALYATPEATPLPDSPASSFPPSPYIINHKRRGPRLLKSHSVDDVASRQKALDKEKVKSNVKNAEAEDIDSTNGHSVTFSIADSTEGRYVNGVHGSSPKANRHVSNGVHDTAFVEGKLGIRDGETSSSNGELGSHDTVNGLAAKKDVTDTVAMNVDKDIESDDFFDLQESMSCTSNTDVEDNNGAEGSARLAATTPVGEFFDARDELSSESGPQLPVCNIEDDLREMRLSMLMEIEKRKQAEEVLSSIQNHWQRIREQLALVGLTLPACPSTVAESEQLANTDPAEELYRQVYLARFVSDSVGRGIAKAEVEIEMEAQIEAKNFEIARLCDRLNYYEAVNREMSQRNQEAIEMARRNRQGSKRRQRWVWGSVAAVITLGTAALAWSYLPSSEVSSSVHDSPAPEGDDSVRG